MPHSQDEDIPDITEWLLPDDEETVEDIDPDDLGDALLVEDEVLIDVAI